MSSFRCAIISAAKICTFLQLIKMLKITRSGMFIISTLKQVEQRSTCCGTAQISIRPFFEIQATPCNI